MNRDVRDSIFNNFNDRIQEIIDIFKYQFFIIHPYTNIKCPCLNTLTKEPDPNCKKCLGTGYKIKIKLVEGASQFVDVDSITKRTDNVAFAKNYYINADLYDIYNEDIIMDKEPFYIYKIDKLTTTDDHKIYYNCLCQLKKIEVDKFKKNFYSIVGEEYAKD